MDDIYTQFVTKTFTKELFLNSIRGAITHMVGVFPPELAQFYTPELLDKIMAVYEDKFSAYFDVQLEVTREVYSEEQVGVLLELQAQHRWLHEKVSEANTLTMQWNHQNTQEMIEIIGRVTEKHLEELEEEAEAMADGQDEPSKDCDGDFLKELAKL